MRCANGHSQVRYIKEFLLAATAVFVLAASAFSGEAINTLSGLTANMPEIALPAVPLIAKAANPSFNQRDFPAPHSEAKSAPARIYNFARLYTRLGYTDAYFGASPDELKALADYTNPVLETPIYKDINAYLRFYPEAYSWTAVSPEASQVIVRHIDSIFTKVPPLPDDIVLFRGITLKFHGNRRYELNEEYIDKAYVSTSLNIAVAKHFVQELNTDKEARTAVLGIYAASPGEKGILIDKGEDEVILRHGGKFKIMDRRALDEKSDFYLVQLCPDSCKTSVREDIRTFWENYTFPAAP